jgi:hypothetical protein
VDPLEEFEKNKKKKKPTMARTLGPYVVAEQMHAVYLTTTSG